MFFPDTEIERSQLIGKIPRYLSQKDKSSCGPIAVINYWKTYGLKVGYKDLKVLRRILATTKAGTFDDKIAGLFGKDWKSVSLLKPPAIVMEDNHYWLCSHKCTGGFIGINYCNRITYHFISNRRMKSILKRSKVL